MLPRSSARRRSGRVRRSDGSVHRVIGLVLPDRRLRIDRRLRDRGTGRPRRLDRLAVLARLRFRRLLRRAARHVHGMAAGRSRRPAKVTKSSRRYWDNTLILETRFETADGTVALIDFMPPRGNASDVVRLVRGVSGRVKLADGAGDPVRLRRRYPLGQAHRGRRAAGDRRAGHDGAANAGRDPRRGPDHGGRLRGRRRRDRSLRAHLRAVASAGPGADQSGATPCRTPRISGPNGAATAPIRATTATW